MPESTEIKNYFLSELEGSSEQVRRVRGFWCEKFLAFAPADLSQWDKRLVNRFRSKLEKEQYAPETVRYALNVVKRTFDAAKAVHENERTRLIGAVNPNDPSAVAEVLQAMAAPGPKWDIGKRFMPRAQASEIVKPAMTFEEIETLVGLARKGKLDDAETAFLVLASVYGYRAGELRAVRLEHIDFDNLTIWVDTEKGGEKRNQLLAEPLIPYLERYGFGYEYSPWKMNATFKSILSKAGLEDGDRKSWHSFRRYGETAIRDALASDPSQAKDAVPITKIYFRYRMASSSEMVDRYYSLDPLEADKLVLERSPIVPLWR